MEKNGTRQRRSECCRKTPSWDGDVQGERNECGGQRPGKGLQATVQAYLQALVLGFMRKVLGTGPYTLPPRAGGIRTLKLDSSCIRCPQPYISLRAPLSVQPLLGSHSCRCRAPSTCPFPPVWPALVTLSSHTYLQSSPEPALVPVVCGGLPAAGTA